MASCLEQICRHCWHNLVRSRKLDRFFQGLTGKKHDMQVVKYHSCPQHLGALYFQAGLTGASIASLHALPNYTPGMFASELESGLAKHQRK